MLNITYRLAVTLCIFVFIFLFIALSWTALCIEQTLLEFQIDLR